MNRNVFISHSNKFIDITKYFSEFLKSRGLTPIVVEFLPNAGQLWSPAEKVKYAMGLCDCAILVATPDEVQDGNPVPRVDVTFELGRLSDKKVIVLKEKSTILPKSIDPVYIPFDLEKPSSCLDQLDVELESIFGTNAKNRVPFIAKVSQQGSQSVYTLDGKNLAPERPDLIQNEVRRVFQEETKEEQSRIIGDIIDHLKSRNDDTRWVVGLMLEEVLEYDSSLVPKEVILKMSRDKSFAVRSAAAVCLFVLANIAPARVPLDVVIRLASPDEDWYVFTPALSTLKILAHRMPRALDAILLMASSVNKDEAESGVSALLEIVRNDPLIMSEERLTPIQEHSKYIRETLAKIREALKRKETGPSVIRYGPF